MKVMGIETCATYKKAVKWFHEHNIAFETVDLRKQPLSIEKIELYHQLSGLPIKKFFNTSGKVYRALDLKNKQTELSNKEIYVLLSTNPMLIKRPLVVDGDFVRTGFQEDEYRAKWL